MKKILTVVLSVALILTGIAPVTSVFADSDYAPTNVKVTPKNTLKEVSVTVSWNDTGADEYQIWRSTGKDFEENNSWHKVVTGTSFKIINRKIANNKTHFFRVRARKDGVWSEYSPIVSKKLVTTTKGIKDSNVSKSVYYKNGLKYTGEKTFGGEKHYFEKGKFVAETKLMWKGVKNAKSKTKYLVITDCNNNRTYIYKGKKGDWKIYKRFKCTTGRSGTPTPKVNRYKPGGNKIKFGGYNNAATKSGPYTCWFASRFQGTCFYHSVIYHRDSQKRIMDGRLGVSKSHGCIRVPLKQALWMYRNIKKGTRIITFGNYIPSPR